MNRNSLRNRPTPTAPASSAAPASPGSSMLASNSTACRRASPPACAAADAAARARARSAAGGSGTPRARSATDRRSRCRRRRRSRPSRPGRIRRLASRAPTTAGMSMLRATIAVCEVLPPTSVTKPVNTLRLNCSMSAGATSLATSTSGSSPAKSRAASAVVRHVIGQRRVARHGAQHALDHLLEIGLAFAQVVVLHLVELPRQHLQLRRQRPLGVVVTIDDPVLRGAGQCLVVQQHQVHVEQRRQLGRRIVRQVALQRAEFRRPPRRAHGAGARISASTRSASMK